MTVIRLNPDTLHKNPAFTQVAVIEPFIYVGGQNAVNPAGKIIGKDIATQTKQVMQNIAYALEAAGASLQNVFKMTIYIVQGHSLHDAFTASQTLSQMPAPLVSVIIVAGLAHPDYLIEIEAVAAL